MHDKITNNHFHTFLTFEPLLIISAVAMGGGWWMSGWFGLLLWHLLRRTRLPFVPCLHRLKETEDVAEGLCVCYVLGGGHAYVYMVR